MNKASWYRYGCHWCIQGVQMPSWLLPAPAGAVSPRRPPNCTPDSFEAVSPYPGSIQSHSLAWVESKPIVSHSGSSSSRHWDKILHGIIQAGNTKLGIISILMKAHLKPLDHLTHIYFLSRGPYKYCSCAGYWTMLNCIVVPIIITFQPECFHVGS